METVKKYWLWGIFISILAVFAMSHNANAVSTVYDLSNYDVVRRLQSDIIDCQFQNAYSVTSGNGGWCSADLNNTGGGTYLYSILTQNSYTVKANDILNFYLIAYSQSGQFEYTPLLYSMNSPLQGWDVVSFQQVNFDDYSSKIEASGILNWQSSGSSSLSFTEWEYNSFYRVYDITLVARSERTTKFGLTQTSSSPIFWFNANDLGKRVRFSIQNFVQYRRIESQENKEVQEKTEEAVNDSQAAGGSSSQDAQTGTTGLLNAITGAVSVISSASPTNCKINGNMGNLDMGQLDLCANPAPAFIQTIGSLILILMCVPLAISLFNRFIAIFRSFQS